MLRYQQTHTHTRIYIHTHTHTHTYLPPVALCLQLVRKTDLLAYKTIIKSQIFVITLPLKYYRQCYLQIYGSNPLISGSRCGSSQFRRPPTNSFAFRLINSLRSHPPGVVLHHYPSANARAEVSLNATHLKTHLFGLAYPS